MCRSATAASQLPRTSVSRSCARMPELVSRLSISVLPQAITSISGANLTVLLVRSSLRCPVMAPGNQSVTPRSRTPLILRILKSPRGLGLCLPWALAIQDIFVLLPLFIVLEAPSIKQASTLMMLLPSTNRSDKRTCTLEPLHLRSEVDLVLAVGLGVLEVFPELVVQCASISNSSTQPTALVLRLSS